MLLECALNARKASLMYYLCIYGFIASASCIYRTHIDYKYTLNLCRCVVVSAPALIHTAIKVIRILLCVDKLPGETKRGETCTQYITRQYNDNIIYGENDQLESILRTTQ